MSDDKGRRVYVNLDAGVIERAERLAKRCGVRRSVVLGWSIYQGLQAMDNQLTKAQSAAVYGKGADEWSDRLDALQ